MEKQGDQQLPPIAYEAYIQNHEQRIALRNINFMGSKVQEQQPKSAQIKAIQKFIGRLKSESKNYQAIITEMQGLNLTKYLEEISALVASCVSEREIRFYSEIATKLNQQYEEIPSMLLKDLNKQFSNAFQSPEDNKQRLKALLLFTTQLFVCGFTFPYKDISEMLKKLVKAGTKKKAPFTSQKELRLFAYYYNCDIYATFLTHFGTIFTQSTSKWVTKWKQEQKVIIKYPQMIPTKTKDDITTGFFGNYINSCANVLYSAFQKLKQLQNQLRQNLRMSGEFNKVIEANYNWLKQKFIFTKKQLAIIIQSMSSNIQLRDYEIQLIQVDDIMKKYINKIDNVEIFENQFQRELYLELPKFSEGQNKNATDEEYKGFREKLDKCKNKSDSDEIVKAFQAINNKRTRKLLSKDIIQYRKQYQLVTPFLCRIAAVVTQVHKDIAENLCQSLFSEYEKLRDNINTNFVVNDKKSRNLKYICQFTKFKIVQSEKAIVCIQNLVDDLKGYNIELLITALQSIGRFLYLSPSHANKFTFLLSKLQNVMKQRSFPLFTTSQLLNSINLLKPHIQAPKEPEPQLTKNQLEARRILSMDIIDDLDEIIPEIQQLVKTKEGLEATQKILVQKIQQYDFLGNYNYAYLLNDLNFTQLNDFVVEATICKLQESVRQSGYQNCLLWSRFFGELYKYELVKRNFLFDQLNRFLTLQGSEIGVINIICTVLQTCDTYLDSKKVQNRNQTFFFLVQFKKYLHKCLYIPMLEQFKIMDIFEDLQPNLTAIKQDILNIFLQDNQDKNKKEFDYSKALDLYLDKKNLKETKPTVSVQTEDPREKPGKQEKQELDEIKNNESVIAESKVFDSQFLGVMNANMKDFSGRIAKPAFPEKLIERKKEKQRKVGEGQRKIVVIGRNSNNKFTRKDVVYVADESSESK